jgi:DNA ligase (NAD+)
MSPYKVLTMIELISLLNDARDAYYNKNKPVMTDREYDSLFDRLKDLEDETGVILSNSPTQTVGYEVVSSLTKVAHTVPLLSLDKTKSYSDLYSFLSDKVGIFMLKADGLTVRLEYDDGKLIRATTRGNGEIGEDITHNAKTFRNIPLTIPYHNAIAIEGEAIIHVNDFDNINSKLSDEEKYATPRNLVAGSVRQLDSNICKQRNVHFYAFGVSTRNDDIPDSKFHQFMQLQDYGFKPIPFAFCQVAGNMESNVSDMLKIATLNFIPIDGLVLAFDSCSYGDSLGATSHHGRNAIAFKFKDEAMETTLREIEWSVGRTGQITPVAIFDPVIIDGTEVSRASVHNISIMKDLELGIGDTISVYKANMIIPQIEENLTRSDGKLIPSNCPSCGARTYQETLNQSTMLYCSNMDCPARIIGKLSHFVSRNAMNIDGLSEATLEKFVEMGIVKNYSDIYKISECENIVGIDGFGEKSFKKLCDAIEKSKNVKMENFLFALGIEGVGQGTAKRIAKHYNGDFQSFVWNARLSNNHVVICTIPDIGYSTADSIYDYFNNENNMFVIDMLFMNGVKIIADEKVTVDTDNPFAGKSMIATGTLDNYTRDSIKTKLESLGVKIVSSVSKKTDFVLAGREAGMSKINKANELGIKIISEEEFENMLGER